MPLLGSVRVNGVKPVSDAGAYEMVGSLVEALALDDGFNVSESANRFLRVVSAYGDARVVSLIVDALKNRFPDASSYLDESFVDRTKPMRPAIMNARIPKSYTPWE